MIENTAEYNKLCKTNLGELHSLQILDFLAYRENMKTEAGHRALVRALANCKLLDSKQQDYGSRNISDFGEYGVIVRLNDKMQRMINLNKKASTKDSVAADSPLHESMLDTWQDISNYGLIGQMLHEGKWPNE